MVEKLSINNEIILMKKTIAQAKVCVINKMVKKLREAKKVVEQSTGTLSLHVSQRPSKIAEQIEYLKRTGNVLLATQCLIRRKSAQQVITNSQATNDEIALAHLSMFKTVAARVLEIKTKYNLHNTSTPDWRESLSSIGKKKQRKLKKETGLKRKAEKKAEAAKEKTDNENREQWLVENCTATEKTEPATDNESENESNSEVETAPSSNPDPKKKTPLKVKAKSDTDIVVKRSKVPAKAAVAPSPSSSDDEMSVADMEPLTVSCSSPERHVDPFFVTDRGSAYLASGFEERHQPLGPQDGLDRRARRAQQFGKPAKRKPNPTFGGQQQQAPPKIGAKLSASNRSASNISTNASNTTPAQQLHPSWLAKQKLKPIISSFQGTKLKFGDDDATAAKSTIGHPANSKNGNATTDSSEQLHPSWLAKQKQKPVISDFQGKKVKFDD